MQYREARSPIVLSDSDSSEESEDEPPKAPESIAISRVVSDILGKEPLEDSDARLFRHPVNDQATLLTTVADEVDNNSESPGES